MTKRVKNGSDYFHFLVVATPIVTLAGIVLLAVFSWESRSSELENALRDISRDNQPLDHASLVRHHDAITTKEGVATWKAILAATGDLEERFGGPFAWAGEDDPYKRVVPPGDSWPVADIVNQFAESGEPIMQKIETLLDSEETIWTPLIGESLNTLLYEVQQSRSVARLLRYTFLNAIHREDNEKAIMTIRASDRFFGPQQDSTFLVGELVQMACYSMMEDDIRESIAANVWTDKQLIEIEAILSKPQDWDARWKSSIQSEMQSFLPVLLDDKIERGMLDNRNSAIPFSLAPSSILSIIQREGKWMDQSAPSTINEITQFQDNLKDRHSGDDDLAMDRLLQIPLTKHRWLTDSLTPAYAALAGSFCRNANDHRFTRTLLAARRFDREFDRWPESLNDLTRVGLPLSETQAMDGGLFAMEIEEEGQLTIYNQAHPTNKHESLGHQPAQHVTLVR